MNELLMLGHVKVMDWLEELDPSTMRMSEAIQFIRLQMDVAKTFAVEPEANHDDDWTEEDDAELERSAKVVKARRYSEDAQGPDEDDSEADDSDEEHSKESEGEST